MKTLLLILTLYSVTNKVYGRDIYLSTQGDDLNTGISSEQSLATLQRAVDLALMDKDGVARVLVAPGLYIGQLVNMRLNGPVQSMRITRSDENEAPVFAGDGTGTWLRLVSKIQQPVFIEINGMHIKNYGTAISIEGSRETEDVWLSGVRLIGNQFEEIGTVKEVQSPSTAAVRFVNVRYSVIANNRFKKILNVRNCELLHPVYLAHFSSGNRIERNIFDTNCGAAIKVRDRSNGNVIEGNLFFNQGRAKFIQDWYCDSTKRLDCSRLECPSWNNQFEDNKIDGNSIGLEALDIRHGERSNSYCSVPSGAKRFLRVKYLDYDLMLLSRSQPKVNRLATKRLIQSIEY